MRMGGDHELQDGTHLARGVDPGCVPLGLVLEVDLVPDEIGFGFVQGDLRLALRSARSRWDKESFADLPSARRGRSTESKALTSMPRADARNEPWQCKE